MTNAQEEYNQNIALMINAWPHQRNSINMMRPWKIEGVNDAFKYPHIAHLLTNKNMFFQHLEIAKILEQFGRGGNFENTENNLIQGNICNRVDRSTPNIISKYNNIAIEDRNYSITYAQPTDPILSIFSRSNLNHKWPCTSFDINNPASISIIDPFIKEIISYSYSSLVFYNIFTVSALNMIDDGLSIAFINPTRDDIKNGREGGMNPGGKISIYLNIKAKSEIFATLIHELTHHVMGVIFKNDNNPYNEGDSQSQAKFDNAIKEVIYSVYKYFLPNVEMPNDKKSIIEGLKKVENNLEYHDQLVVRLIYQTLFGYNDNKMHSEFIARFTQIITELGGELSNDIANIFQPFIEYYKEIVTPSMINYINSHPYNDNLIIEDVYSENLLSYASDYYINKTNLSAEVCDFSEYFI